MKRISGLLVCVVALAMLCLTACSVTVGKGGYSAAKSYKTVTTHGLTLDVRDDMELDTSQKNADGDPIEAYNCEYYGMTVVAVPSAQLKFSGVTETKDVLSKAVSDAGLADNAEIKTHGDVVSICYENTVNETLYHFRSYALDLGYHFYLVEFSTPNESDEEYIAEYEKIVATGREAETSPATVEIVVDGVKVTVDGDATAFDEAGSTYITSRYMVMPMKQEIDISANDFCRILLSSSDDPYVTDTGETVTEYETLPDTDINYFSAYHNGMYLYNYIQNIDGKIVYTCFMTMQKADDSLISDLNEIAKTVALTE